MLRNGDQAERPHLRLLERCVVGCLGGRRLLTPGGNCTGPTRDVAIHSIQVRFPYDTPHDPRENTDSDGSRAAEDAVSMRPRPLELRPNGNGPPRRAPVQNDRAPRSPSGRVEHDVQWVRARQLEPERRLLSSGGSRRDMLRPTHGSCRRALLDRHMHGNA